MKKFKILFVSLIFIMFCGKAFAWQCSILTPSYTVNLPSNITVQRDTPTGQAISDWYDTGVSDIYHCDTSGSGGSSYVVVEHTTLSENLGTYTDNGVAYKISPTNIEGVGIVIRAKSKGSGPLSDYYNFPYGRWISSSYNNTYTFEFDAGARLIKIGKMNSGVLSGASAGYVDVLSASSGSYYYNVPVSYTGTTITVLACSIQTPALNTPMGEYMTTDFTEVGHVTEDKDVPISLDCDAGARINAAITADADTNTTQPGAIKLNNGGATGVAVQLLDKNGKGVKLNQKFVVDTTTADGQYDFNWKARYLQTQSTVTPGDANASATLTLTYE